MNDAINAAETIAATIAGSWDAREDAKKRREADAERTFEPIRQYVDRFNNQIQLTRHKDISIEIGAWELGDKPAISLSFQKPHQAPTTLKISIPSNGFVNIGHQHHYEMRSDQSALFDELNEVLKRHLGPT